MRQTVVAANAGGIGTTTVAANTSSGESDRNYYNGNKSKIRGWWGWRWLISSKRNIIFLILICVMQLFLLFASLLSAIARSKYGLRTSSNYFHDVINDIERFYYLDSISSAVDGVGGEAEDPVVDNLLRNEDSEMDIIIGGAGMAGISGGKTLSELAPHLNFQIHEASYRVGGRMYPFQFGKKEDRKVGKQRRRKYTFEMGANWLDGTNSGNPLSTLVKENGMSGTVQAFNYRFYNETGGRDYNEEQSKSGTATDQMRKIGEAIDSFGEYCRRRSSSRGKKRHNAKRSTKTLLCDRIEDNNGMTVQTLYRKIGKWNPLKDTNKNSKGAKGVAAQFLHFDLQEGAGADDVSAKVVISPNPTYDDFGKDDYLIADKRGYSFTAKALGAQYLATSTNTLDNIEFDDDRLVLGSKVILIKWDATGKGNVEVIRCMTEKVVRDDGVVTYPCKRNIKAFSRIIAKQFISTFSVEVLKKSVELERKGTSLYDSIDIAPRFYPYLSSTDLGDAMNQNALGLYVKAFFQFEENFWGNDAEYAVSAYSANGYRGDFAPVWQNYDKKGLYPGSGVMALYTAGQRAKHLGELTDEQAKQELLPVLNLNYKREIWEMYGRELRVDDILDFKMSRWAQDPLFYGGFTYIKSGQTLESKTLTQRGIGNLYISGENTCDNHPGYVHGAMFAGNRSVRILLNEQYPGFESLETRTLCDTPLSDL